MVHDERWTTAGAIASKRAAELYELEVIEEGIQDFKDNVTRFIVLSRCGVRSSSIGTPSIESLLTVVQRTASPRRRL